MSGLGGVSKWFFVSLVSEFGQSVCQLGSISFLPLFHSSSESVSYKHAVGHDVIW